MGLMVQMMFAAPGPLLLRIINDGLVLPRMMVVMLMMIMKRRSTCVKDGDIMGAGEELDERFTKRCSREMRRIQNLLGVKG